MTDTRYAIIDGGGVRVHNGPAQDFGTMTEALLALAVLYTDCLDYRVIPVEGPALPTYPLPPLPVLDS